MKEMIRRFDELLATKANKQSLLELEHKIGEQFLRVREWDKLNEKFNGVMVEIGEKMAKNADFVNNQKTAMNALVTQIITEKLEFMLQKYDKVATGFSKFFN
jgi:hypothetical protein